MHVCGSMSVASLSLSQNVVALILVLWCYFVSALYLDQHANAASSSLKSVAKELLLCQIYFLFSLLIKACLFTQVTEVKKNL